MYQTILKISSILLVALTIIECRTTDSITTAGLLPRMTITKQSSYLHDSIIKIELSGSGCSGVVVSDQYALTAAHCVESDWGGLDGGEVVVYNQLSVLTDAIGKAVAMDTDRDVALIRGDFRAFKPRPVDWSGTKVKFDKGSKLISCGFPAGQRDLYCTTEYYFDHSRFQHLMHGSPIFRGCSGGPVFSADGWVIGVNSAVAANYLYVGPVIGFLKEVGLERR